MNSKSKIRLTVGFIFVTILATILTMYVDASRAALASETAEIAAESYGVGTDYTGLVTKQNVQEGDQVKEGQVLFQVKSSTLLDQMRRSALSPDQLIYPLNDEGEILIKAARPGTISRIYYGKGSFVPANEEIATIIDEGSARLTATYQLARRDFTKLSKRSRISVRLPDGIYINTTADNITVTEQSDVVETEIETKLAGFRPNKLEITSGTPVTTRLYLTENTLWHRAKSLIGSVF